MTFAEMLRNQWDRAGAALAAGVGILALLLGYFGISRTAYPAEQLPYLVSGGAFGLFMLGVAAVLWLTADLRDEWRKLDDLDQHLQALLELEVARDEFAEAVIEEEQLPRQTAARVREPAAPTRTRRAATRDAT
jgi:hypothetical protein